MAKRPQIRGMYQIKSVKTNRVYIGIANSIYRRWEDHKRLLSKNTHNNIILQNHVRKYGMNDLIFNIIELSDHLTFRELKIKEILTIKKYKKLNIKLFNLTDGGDGTLGQGVKSCKIKNIFSGEILEFESMTDAAEFIGVDRSSMSKILKGKKKQMKGWCSESIPYSTSEYNRKTRVLYHKDYGEVTVGVNMCKFAEKYNLDKRVIHRLFTKPDRVMSYKGWTTYNPKLESKIHKKHRRVASYNTDKNLIEEFDTMTDAANKYNCSITSLSQALKKPLVATCRGLYWKYL
jgi:group I intron endonuclease